MNKEELRKEFETWYFKDFDRQDFDSDEELQEAKDSNADFIDELVEWFWKQLEQRDELIKAADEVIDKSNKLFSSLYEATEKSGAKVLITDADNINIQSIKLAELIESYTTLKQQMK